MGGAGLVLPHPGVTVCPAWLDNCHVDDHCCTAWGGGKGLDHDIMSGAINWDQAGGERGGEGRVLHCNYQIDEAVQDHQYLL